MAMQKKKTIMEFEDNHTQELKDMVCTNDMMQKTNVTQDEAALL